MLAQLLTITRYELLMQMKSIRFKGICVLALLADYGMYDDAARTQRFDPLETFLSMEMIVFYLVPVVFAAMFSIDRVRSSGMQPILMTKPFPTALLMAGQLVACVVSLLIPLALIFFPTAALLRLRYGIEFRYEPLLYVITFFFIPGFCCILAITIWIRTCFKNNLMALIILGFVFAGSAFLANSRWLNSYASSSVDGLDIISSSSVHQFVPMVSFFSQTYWGRLDNLFKTTEISFTESVEWLHFFLNIGYSVLFLILASYHLRRTEPQRKVLGNYGRRWYHAPTFVKMACDLKIDPHLGLREHFVLFLFVSVIGANTVWPITAPLWNNYRAARRLAAERDQGLVSLRDGSQFLPPRAFAEENILQIRILRDEQIVGPRRLTSRLTVKVPPDAAGKVAALTTHRRSEFVIESITLDGRELAHLSHDGFFFLSGEELAPYADGRPHVIEIGAVRRGTTGQGTSRHGLWGVRPRGYSFALQKETRKDAYGTPYSVFQRDPSEHWPIHLALTMKASAKLLRSPVEPVVSKEGKSTIYVFDVPAVKTKDYPGILFSELGNYELIDLGNSRLPLRLAVPRSHRAITEELLDLTEPVLEEFWDLHELDSNSPLVLVAVMDRSFGSSIEKIDRYHVSFRRNGRFYSWQREPFINDLASFQSSLLTEVLLQSLNASSLQPLRKLWDLEWFLRINVDRGLNGSITLKRTFKPRAFTPVFKHMRTQDFVKKEHTPHHELMDAGQIPVFQMLYHVMGDERWRRMLVDLKIRLGTEFLSRGLLQEVAQSVTDEPLDEFFDYWCGEQEGFPSYRVNSASFELLKRGPGHPTEYLVSAEIENLGSGRMPVPLILSSAKNQVPGTVWIGPHEKVQWQVRSRELPVDVRVDPSGWIMMAPYFDENARNWIMNPRADVESAHKG